MIFLNSQLDPSVASLTMGQSGLTVRADGCFLSNIGTVFQRLTKELLSVPGAFDASGDLFPAVLAAHCGGQYLGQTTTPTTAELASWVIIETHDFAPRFPTHFVCYFQPFNLMIDPLDCDPVTHQSKVSPMKYGIVNYRIFSGVTLPAPIFPDVLPDDPAFAAISNVKAKGIMTGLADGTFNPNGQVTRRQLAQVIDRLQH